MHRSCFLIRPGSGNSKIRHPLDSSSFLFYLFPSFPLSHLYPFPLPSSPLVFRRYQSTNHATPSHSFFTTHSLNNSTQCSRTHRSSKPSSSSPRSSPSSPPSRATRTTTSPPPPGPHLLPPLRVVSAIPARRTAASRCIRAIATRSRAPLDLLDCLFLERAVLGLTARA